MKILITGANGFLGSSIVRQALASGLAFRATDLQSDSYMPGIDYISADITNPSTLTPVLTGITGVIHAAGLAHIFDISQAKKASFNAINVTGTVNMIHAAVLAGAKSFVLVSSVSVYGKEALMINEAAPCHPQGPYAESKWQAEQRAIEIAGAAGLNLTILRLATLYGEGDPGNVGRLIGALDRGRFFWIGDGRNRKSLLYKGDAARACLTAVNNAASGVHIYNVSAPPCTMREIVDGITAALGKRPLPVRVPASLALLLSRNLSRIPIGRVPGIHQTLKKWLAEDVYDTGRFEEDCRFKTKTGLSDGLKREVDWYRKNHKNGRDGRNK